jgi:hypothetical protein
MSDWRNGQEKNTP